MNSLYHKEAFFEDPAFGRINVARASMMWTMLTTSKNLDAIDYEILASSEEEVRVFWQAYYRFGPKERPVHNKIISTLRFKDGLIVDHKDEFSLYRWAIQALGGMAYLMAWTPYFKKKLQQETNKRLDRFIAKT